MEHKKTFLGIGWKFPPTFDKKSKTNEMVSEENDIKESLLILLATQPGERVMRPEYGCDTKTLAFNTVNTTNLNFLASMIEKAIKFYEPRILLENIDISTKDILDGKLLIDIQYIVRTTNSRNNVVYPYYILEGTNLSQIMLEEQ